MKYFEYLKRFKDWINKTNESVDEKWHKISDFEMNDFISSHKNEDFTTNEYNIVKERFGIFGNWNNIKRKFWFNLTRSREHYTGKYYDIIVVNEGEYPPSRQFYITKWNDEWFKIEYHYQVGLKYQEEIFICDQLDGLLSLIDYLKELS